MSKHTPGPWIVTERRHPYKDGNKAHIERNIYTAWKHPQLKDNYPVVCTSVGIGMDGKKAVQFVHIDEANACLIAAAPDLLDALKGLHDDIMDYIRLNNLGAENNHWLVQARAAIAKATGEQA